MAWAPDPTCVISYRYRDDDGAAARAEVHLAAALFASGAARTFAQVLYPLLLNTTNCAIVGFSVRLRYADSDPPPVASGISASVAGVFLYRTSAAELYVSTVPGIKAGCVLATGAGAGVELDPLNPDLLALTAAMLTGIGGLEPVAYWGPGAVDDLVSIDRAYRGFQEVDKT